MTLKPHVINPLPPKLNLKKQFGKRFRNINSQLQDWNKQDIPSDDVLRWVHNESCLSNHIEGIYDSRFNEAYSNILTSFLSEEVKSLNINVETIKEIHHRLLSSVPLGKENITVGEFRNRQNAIVKYIAGFTIPIYLPPKPEDVLPSVLSLCDYISNSTDDPILKIGLVHGQFEMIHPFDDGNGRVGRILIPIMFQKLGLVKQGLFLSWYFKMCQADYYAGLKALQSDDWITWIDFYLSAVEETLRQKLEIGVKCDF